MQEKCDQRMMKQAAEDDYLKDYFTTQQEPDVRSVEVEVTCHTLENHTFMMMCIFS